MKLCWLTVMVCGLCACAGTYVHPAPVAEVMVSMREVALDCTQRPLEGVVVFEVENRGKRRVAFYLSSQGEKAPVLNSRAPYEVHMNYASLKQRSEVNGEYRHAMVRSLDHYFPPTTEVMISPNDRTDFRLDLAQYSIYDPQDYDFRIDLMDHHTAIYRSQPFRLCDPAPGA